MAAREAVLSGRAVALVELEVLRVCSGRSRAGDSSWGPGDSGSLEGERRSRDGERSSLDDTSLDGERSCEGELGASRALAVPPVFSHGGAFCEAAGVSLGFSGELVGVEGRAVEGEPCLTEPGRPKGDWREPRALLKKRGEGFESAGADCGMLVSRSGRERRARACIP